MRKEANTNLLLETLNILERNGKTWNDVRYVLCRSSFFTPEEAKPMMDFDYYSGYGSEQVELSLMVVGKDWWLERHEYDGSEWWEFKSLPSAVGCDEKYQWSSFRNHSWKEPEECSDWIGNKLRGESGTPADTYECVYSI